MNLEAKDHGVGAQSHATFPARGIRPNMYMMTVDRHENTHATL